MTMSALPATTPHFIGLVAAMALGLLATVVLTRSAVVARLGGARGAVVAGTVLLLAAVGLLGNGVQGSAGRGQAFSAARLDPPRAVSEAAVERARDVGLSDRFIAYHGRLQATAVVFTGHSLSSCVRWSWEADPGAGVGGLAPRGARALRYEYEDTDNWLFARMGLGTEARSQRALYLQELVNQYLRDLVLLEALREAPDAEARAAALAGLRSGVAMAAEWILAELDHTAVRFATEPERAALAETQAYVRRYVDDPTLRALPAGRRVVVE